MKKRALAALLAFSMLIPNGYNWGMEVFVVLQKKPNLEMGIM